MKARKWMLHVVDRSCISRPTLPQLRHIIAEDPRVKVYYPFTYTKFADSIGVGSADSLCTGMEESDKEKPWNHLREEESLFYKQVQSTQNQSENNNSTSGMGIESPDIDDIFDEIIHSFQDDRILDTSRNSSRNSLFKHTMSESSRLKVNKILNQMPAKTLIENPFLSNTVVENPFLSNTFVNVKSEPKSPTSSEIVIDENQHEQLDEFRNNNDRLKSLLGNSNVPVLCNETHPNKNNIEENLCEKKWVEQSSRRQEYNKCTKNPHPGISSTTVETNSQVRESSFERELRKLKETLLAAKNSETRTLSRSRSRSRKKSSHSRSPSIDRASSIFRSRTRSKSPYSELKNRWRSKSRKPSPSENKFQNPNKSKLQRSVSRSKSPRSPPRLVKKKRTRSNRSSSSRSVSRNKSPTSSSRKRKTTRRSASRSPISPHRHRIRSQSRNRSNSRKKSSLSFRSHSKSPSRKCNRKKSRHRSKYRMESPLGKSRHRSKSRMESPLGKSRHRSKSRMESPLGKSRHRSKSRMESPLALPHRSKSPTGSKPRDIDSSKQNRIPIYTISSDDLIQTTSEHTEQLAATTSDHDQIEQLNLMDVYASDKSYINSNSWKSQRRKQNIKMPHQEIHCSVCNVYTNTMVQYHLHINSRKHKKKEALLETVLKGGPILSNQSQPLPSPIENLRCDVCQKYNFTSVDAYNSHMMSTKHVKMFTATLDQVSEPTPAIEAIESIQKYSEKVFVNEEMEIEVKKKSGLVEKHCATCNITVNSEEQFKNHLISKKHKRAANNPWKNSDIVCDLREFTRAGITDPALRYMYVSGRGGTIPGGGPSLGLPTGWGGVVRPPPTGVGVGAVTATVTAPADLLATISMFEQHVKAEPMGFYASTALNRDSSLNGVNSTDNKEQQQLIASNIVCPSTTKSSGGSSRSGHSRSKPQACKVCGKVLSSASSYYVHMKLHSGNKPFTCTCCEAAFCRKPYLEVHMRTHTGERPFQCELCLKRFTQKSSLNTHKRVHTGERPYACDICEKRFAVKSYVTAHRWSHVADKPLTCDRCSLTFTSKSQFAIHIRTHSAAQSYECNICGRTFVRDSYLIRHHNRVHRENPNNTSQVAATQTQTQRHQAQQTTANDTNNTNNNRTANSIAISTFNNNASAASAVIAAATTAAAQQQQQQQLHLHKHQQSLRYVTTSTQMSPTLQDKSPSSPTNVSGGSGS